MKNLGVGTLPPAPHKHPKCKAPAQSDPTHAHEPAFKRSRIPAYAKAKAQALGRSTSTAINEHGGSLGTHNSEGGSDECRET